MLRVSSQSEGEKVELGALVAGSDQNSGLKGSDQLVAFAEAAIGDDRTAITEARQAVHQVLGEPAMVDAAGVIANFQRMVRIADGTGIPLDDPVMMLTADIREDLGINAYGGAENSEEVSTGKRLVARLLQPFLSRLVSLVAPR